MKERSSILRILLHAFFLIAANLFSVMTAFAMVQIFVADADKFLQSSIALIVNVGVYMAVYMLMNRIQSDIMKIENFSMFAIILLISLALLPSIFYPMYYLIQGKWSSFDNLLVTWPFQLVVNGICLVINYYIIGKRSS